MNEQIGVLIDAQLHNELILRNRKPDGVSHIINNVLRDFLDRTKFDDDLWSDQYIQEIQEIESDEHFKKYGQSNKGYYWQALFLPNGTRLRMWYKGIHYHAEIRHEELMFKDKTYSPSEFASIVANHTSRNAWRDIEVCFPNEKTFVLADVVRRNLRERTNG
jgi:hypothetical protein